MTLTLQTRKPRNPLIAPCLQRRAGAHRASEKSRRQTTKRELRAAWPPRRTP